MKQGAKLTRGIILMMLLALIAYGIAAAFSALEKSTATVTAIAYKNGTEVGRDVLYVIVGTHCLVVPQDSLHLDKVNEALEGLLSTYRHTERNWVSAQYVLHLLYYIKEVGT